jgi:hypothetical protein
VAACPIMRFVDMAADALALIVMELFYTIVFLAAASVPVLLIAVTFPSLPSWVGVLCLCWYGAALALAAYSAKASGGACWCGTRRRYS